MAIAAERKVIYEHGLIGKDYDSPITNLMIAHHKVLEDAVTSFKLEFGREPDYSEITVKYEVYLGIMQLELIEEIQHQ